jgi:Mg2+-importing ATPase
MRTIPVIPEFCWSLPREEVQKALDSGPEGLTANMAAERLTDFGPNEFEKQRHHPLMNLFLSRFRNPLLLILIFGALVSLILRDWIDACIILGIIVISAVLGTIQEHRASNAVERLRKRVALKSKVMRDGKVCELLTRDIVPGDVVLLSAGSLVPADGLIIEATDCYLNQAILTGETFPAEKHPGTIQKDAPLAERTNMVFMGTSVRSGTAVMLVTATGFLTEFGRIAETVSAGKGENEFELGLRQFGLLLLRIMIFVVLAVLAINIALKKPTVETLLFAMALAVGLSPELLPAILAITLSKGAMSMAERGVIVRHLNAIETLGSMDVLCTDKTGTLTKGVVSLDNAVDINGAGSRAVLLHAFLNASFQTGLENPLDKAVAEAGLKAALSTDGYRKVHEIPYDFVRKCLSVAVFREDENKTVLITKGALQQTLDRCSSIAAGNTGEPLDRDNLTLILQQFTRWSEEGFRVLGVAYKQVETQATYSRDDENGMVFLGFLLFFDPPEPDVRKTLDRLKALGVRTTIITGDNHLVARHVAEAVNMNIDRVITGAELAAMKDEALWNLVSRRVLFAEVDPNQKERIIRAYRKTGHVVGYLGDGINDAPALQAADAGISVDNAVDVAREAADFVLLKHDLESICAGIGEGRHTFANTLKYIFITTSANFGNMISMAAASLFLPFLPLLAKQVLLNNFLSDIPAMGIAGDNVDREWEITPHRWNIDLVRNFMVVFGLLSTAFDMLTFGILWNMAGDSPELFRTGWFIESLLTELLILFVIRTFKPFSSSRPGRFLLSSAIMIAIVTMALPYIPGNTFMNFQPLPPSIMLTIISISLFYGIVSEGTKRAFSKRLGRKV